MIAESIIVGILVLGFFYFMWRTVKKKDSESAGGPATGSTKVRPGEKPK